MNNKLLRILVDSGLNKNGLNKKYKTIITSYYVHYYERTIIG